MILMAFHPGDRKNLPVSQPAALQRQASITGQMAFFHGKHSFRGLLSFGGLLLTLASKLLECLEAA